jgi:hypothetical protein
MRNLPEDLEIKLFLWNEISKENQDNEMQAKVIKMSGNGCNIGTESGHDVGIKTSYALS